MNTESEDFTWLSGLELGGCDAQIGDEFWYGFICGHRLNLIPNLDFEP